MNTSPASPELPTQFAPPSSTNLAMRAFARSCMKTFHLPDLGEGLAEAEIVRWHVSTGDHINADDPMLAVETAKAIVEVPSPFSGVIKATYGNPGDTVATGGLLVEFEADAAPETASTTSAAAAPHIARNTS